MIKCISAKSIKDDDNLSNERGVFTLAVGKTETKLNRNCRTKWDECLKAQCDNDLS